MLLVLVFVVQILLVPFIFCQTLQHRNFMLLDHNINAAVVCYESREKGNPPYLNDVQKKCKKRIHIYIDTQDKWV